MIGALAALMLMADDGRPDYTPEQKAFCEEQAKTPHDLEGCLTLAWASTRIDFKSDGWKLSGVLPGFVYLSRPGTGAFQVWIRTEARKGQSNGTLRWRSDVILYAMDCANGSVRQIQASFFPENNLHGSGIQVPTPGGATTYAPPGSVLAEVLRITCPKGRGSVDN